MISIKYSEPITRSYSFYFNSEFIIFQFSFTSFHHSSFVCSIPLISISFMAFLSLSII